LFPVTISTTPSSIFNIKLQVNTHILYHDLKYLQNLIQYHSATELPDMNHRYRKSGGGNKIPKEG
jgi:hypothetical protein